jgi:3-deoxy-D-manno-octulosonic-acid transferase
MYFLITTLYFFTIRFAALFIPKAKLWVNGRKNFWQNINPAEFSNHNWIWIHCASLGEFEQGRPLIEKIKTQHPHYKILLTFFSPSGYEIRKNYSLADKICYLPADTPKNAKRFIEIVKPQQVFFIKYEFWYYFLKTLYQKNIPVYLVSAIFRTNQVFFKPWGGFYRQILGYFKHIFVQNKASADLLRKINISDFSVNGDTRFDRVANIVNDAKTIPLINSFKNNCLTIIAGSTWPDDEKLLVTFINQNKALNLRYIIVPHEINHQAIAHLKQSIQAKCCLYSENKIKDATVLIIDTIGILSSAYKYADIAYIGGGFGKGIHNTLEAATYGLPVIFGPRYQKFDEACELIRIKAGFSIQNQMELNKILLELINNTDFRTESGTKAKEFVNQNIGASDRIIADVFSQDV